MINHIMDLDQVNLTAGVETVVVLKSSWFIFTGIVATWLYFIVAL